MIAEKFRDSAVSSFLTDESSDESLQENRNKTAHYRRMIIRVG